MSTKLTISSEEWLRHHTAPEGLSEIEKAKFYIARCTPHIGSFAGTDAVVRFIHDCAMIIEGPPLPPDPFWGRPMRKSSVAFAMQLAGQPFQLQSPETEVGATFLVVLIESFLREISGLLNWDGTWKSPNDRVLAGQRSSTLSKDPGRARYRLSDVEITYELAVATQNQSDPRADHLRDLEAKIKSEAPQPPNQNLGQRIAQLRHRVAHGTPVGADSEGRFYCLLVIILIFGAPNWTPPT